MTIKILSAGPLSTIQDNGRFGYQEYGFSPSGAADPASLRRLNILLCNDPKEAAIEMTMHGMRLLFERDCVFALCGADMKPHLNGTPIPMEHALLAKEGDILECFRAHTGMRTYFGVHGGFAVKDALGSKSTGMRFSLGGWNGRKLKAFDRIPLNPSPSLLPDMEKRRFPTISYPNEVTLRVIYGPQDDRFPGEMRKHFTEQAYSVSAKMDRMGIRFEGEPLPDLSGTDIISDAIVTAAIQITNEGLPILLLQDRQTTGGYAKIACVISCDLAKAGQLRPGNVVHFHPVSLARAQFAYKREEARYQRLARSLNKERK